MGSEKSRYYTRSFSTKVSSRYMTKRARQREKAGRVTDSDGYKGKRVSESHRPTTACFDGSDGEGGIALIRRAARERWPVREEARGPLAEMLLEIAMDEEADISDKLLAARTVLTMEAQNQKDEHLIFQQQNAQPQLHAHAAVDPEHCRTRILEAIDAEIARRETDGDDLQQLGN